MHPRRLRTIREATLCRSRASRAGCRPARVTGAYCRYLGVNLVAAFIHAWKRGSASICSSAVLLSCVASAVNSRPHSPQKRNVGGFSVQQRWYWRGSIAELWASDPGIPMPAISATDRSMSALQRWTYVMIMSVVTLPHIISLMVLSLMLSWVNGGNSSTPIPLYRHYRDEERKYREPGDIRRLENVLGEHAEVLFDDSDYEGSLCLLQEQKQVCRTTANITRLVWCL